MTDLRIAVLTDVHGNAFGLEAVLADIRQHSPDLIANLGDQVWGQADPRRALELQKNLGAVEVRGNNDERLTLATSELAPAQRPLQVWLAEQLPAADLHRLAALPTTALLADGAVLAAHGTPSTPWDSLLISWNGEGYAHRPESEIRQRLEAAPAAEVVLVGHMHRERVRRVDGRLLVSVGPVSSQGDGDPRARWAFLSRRRGVWQVELRRVEYDWHAALAWEKKYGPVEAINHPSPPHLPMRDAEEHPSPI